MIVADINAKFQEPHFKILNSCRNNDFNSLQIPRAQVRVVSDTR